MHRQIYILSMRLYTHYNLQPDLLCTAHNMHLTFTLNEVYTSHTLRYVYMRQRILALINHNHNRKNHTNNIKHNHNSTYD